MRWNPPDLRRPLRAICHVCVVVVTIYRPGSSCPHCGGSLEDYPHKGGAPPAE